MKIATIIPFYQREAGLLKRVIASVLKQEGDFENKIILVDDGCPLLSCRDELKQAGLSDHPSIIFLEKPNGGVASARNYGLDHLPEGTEAVAFLDSDDFWADDHLKTAMEGLSAGFDFYFADHRREDWASSKFKRLNFEYDQFAVIDEALSLRSYNRDLAYDCLNRHLIQTSTVVVRTYAIADIRFPKDTALFEDDLTWGMIAQAGIKICFANKIGVILGKGVNISLVETWGTIESFRKTVNLLASWLKVENYLEMNADFVELRDMRIILLKKDLLRHVLIGKLGSKIFSLP